MYIGHHWGWDWGWMAIGVAWLIMLLFWGGIILLAVWAMSRLTGDRGRRGAQSPLDIAKERYARGEITREQFEQLRQDLS